MPKKVRFGIIGAGVIAPNHAKAIARSDNAELVAVCDIINDRAVTLASEYNVSKIYTDYHELVTQSDIDVVSVCVPSGIHGEVTIAAAQAKKHVLCEKPLEITADKMTAMISACRENGVKLGGVFQRRTIPAAIATKEALAQGKLGKIVLGDAYLKYYRSPEYYKSAGWRGTWQLDGGGALMNQGVHGVDLIQWMAGKVESVFARCAPLVRDIEVEDTAVAVLKYKNGAFGVIQGTTSVYPGQETKFEIHGEHGSIIFADSGFKLWQMDDGDSEPPQVKGEKKSASSDPKNISQEGHFILVNDMAQAVIDNREPMVPGEEARKAVDLILAIYESAKTGKEVKV